MPGLRDLLEVGAGVGGALDFEEFHVFNSNKTTQNNGGACCLFTVPAGVTWFAIEMWGGGGGGAGACCCRAGWPGGSGSYARKFVTNISEGDEYTICAAGSTYCSQSYCCGCVGYPSFVRVNGGAIEACASGGSQGGTNCYFMIGCNCQFCVPYQCGSWQGGFGLCGVTGSAKGNPFCSQNAYGFMPGAPFTTGGNRPTMSYCVQCHGSQLGGDPHWPGGGGASAVTHDNRICCGQYGAGGLVTIYYPVSS
jgi:hypothetical protein